MCCLRSTILFMVSQQFPIWITPKELLSEIFELTDEAEKERLRKYYATFAPLFYSWVLQQFYIRITPKELLSELFELTDETEKDCEIEKICNLTAMNGLPDG
ncbi:hypothetical protein CEXT_801611 [Caerostris extrusa]|uniref:Uncharacterized protein n=1 Tax=Caerostris extrusa TaxID=172846 RepID=A0AAV4XF79_CAEEX|nr:hypothetical protein CEXT_801611 [Caerostris extrusa]